MDGEALETDALAQVAEACAATILSVGMWDSRTASSPPVNRTQCALASTDIREAMDRDERRQRRGAIKNQRRPRGDRMRRPDKWALVRPDQ